MWVSWLAVRRVWCTCHTTWSLSSYNQCHARKLRYNDTRYKCEYHADRTNIDIVQLWHRAIVDWNLCLYNMQWRFRCGDLFTIYDSISLPISGIVIICKLDTQQDSQQEASLPRCQLKSCQLLHIRTKITLGKACSRWMTFKDTQGHRNCLYSTDYMSLSITVITTTPFGPVSEILPH